MCIGSNWAEFAIIAVVVVGNVLVYINDLKAERNELRRRLAVRDAEGC